VLRISDKLRSHLCAISVLLESRRKVFREIRTLTKIGLSTEHLWADWNTLTHYIQYLQACYQDSEAIHVS
jgi:hypothetical protein